MRLHEVPTIESLIAAHVTGEHQEVGKALSDALESERNQSSREAIGAYLHALNKVRCAFGSGDARQIPVLIKLAALDWQHSWWHSQTYHRRCYPKGAQGWLDEAFALMQLPEPEREFIRLVRNVHFHIGLKEGSERGT
jgi:hypothetical protein